MFVVVVSDLAVKVVKHLAYTVQRVDILLVVMHRDFVDSSFECVGQHLDDRGERVIWTHEIGFDEIMGRFDLRSCTVIKMGNIFCPCIDIFICNR